MKTYDIWMEGYNITGNSAGACYVGSAEGSTFRKACQNYAGANPGWALHYYDPKSNDYWGCGLFPTENQARKAFG